MAVLLVIHILFFLLCLLLLQLQLKLLGLRLQMLVSFGCAAAPRTFMGAVNPQRGSSRAGGGCHRTDALPTPYSMLIAAPPPLPDNPQAACKQSSVGTPSSRLLEEAHANKHACTCTAYSSGAHACHYCLDQYMARLSGPTYTPYFCLHIKIALKATQRKPAPTTQML